MTFDLDGGERKRLRDAVCKAFPDPSALHKLAQDQFDVNLWSVVSAMGNIDTWTFELINWMRSKGRLAEFINLPTDGRYPPVSGTPQKRRERTLEALLAVLLRVAEQGPVGRRHGRRPRAARLVARRQADPRHGFAWR